MNSGLKNAVLSVLVLGLMTGCAKMRNFGEAVPELTEGAVAVADPARSVQALAEPVPKPSKLCRIEILFAFAKSGLDAEAKRRLDTVIELANGQEQGVLIGLVGRTDRLGTKKANLALSRRRAAAVEKYLVAKGIESWRIETEAIGSLGAKAKTKAGRRLERAVSVDVVSVRGKPL